MGMSPTDPGIRIALAKGLLTPDQLGEPARGTRAKVPLVEPAFHPGVGWAEWVVPVRVESEANKGGTLPAAIARKGAVKRAVFAALAPHWRTYGPFGDAFRAGRVLRVRLVRIGGRTLDRSNLPRAMKVIEDVVATVLGCNDGSSLWDVSWGQEPGPKYGVRIELDRGGPT